MSPDRSDAPACLIELGVTPEETCPYLHDRDASLCYFQPILPSAAELDELLARGLRRHGSLFYLPHCPRGCLECVPIRIPVVEFRLSRSQRRLLRRCRDLYTVRLVEPHFREEHLDLFNRHARHVSPSAGNLGREEYASFLIDSAVETRLVEYRLENRLAGVGVLDLGHLAVSSVYFFWEPEFHRHAPGTFSVLHEIGWCRSRGYRYYYLGYWVRDCPSMSYKKRFRPHEFLDWRRGVWNPGGKTPAAGKAGEFPGMRASRGVS